MVDSTFEYWRPGSEERKLRLFISHRYGADEALYTQVIAALERQGFAVQDVSLTKEQVLTGPRGGMCRSPEFRPISPRASSLRIFSSPRAAWA